VGRDTPTRRAISAFGTPSAASNTILARFAAAAVTVCDRTIAANRCSSPSRSTNGAAIVIPHCVKITPYNN